MGASPSSAFFLDGRIVKEGMFSGRLSALPGRDALAFAEATIRPYREYRLSLWIRTGAPLGMGSGWRQYNCQGARRSAPIPAPAIPAIEGS